MKTIDRIINFRVIALLFAAIIIVSCSDDDDAPAIVNELEVITDVTLIFTSSTGEVIMATAEDPDGEGIANLAVLDTITLSADTDYTLTYSIENALNADDVEDIGEEILEEDNEHQFFYSFTDGVFTSPMGDGNIDMASDPLNYDDMDENGLPVGLSTSWTTGPATATAGMFTARLQHQPDLKSGTTGATDGDTDFDLAFTLTIE